MAKKDMIERIKEVMKDPQRIRNVATSSHVHHGKTTLTDNLMAGAGMIAEELAGKVMYTWFDEQERKRELTIYGANVSMVHEYEGKDYLINLVDTPGHVDFGGDVTRAMRAVDGTIVLVCAVEGIMPQTETVFRQALRERVKPVLFINKVDRVIRELNLTPEKMQERFTNIIREVNALIMKYAEPQFAKDWIVNVANGTVAFGSAYKRWAISIPYMQKTGITFKDIINLVNEGKDDELAKLAPLHKVVLDMIIKHLPSPAEAQRYRLERIWKGDMNSDIAKQMMACDARGHLAAIVTKMVPDPHVGVVATARLFSGKVYQGQNVYLVTKGKQEKIQQVAVYKGIQRIQVNEITAGNIAAIVGIPDAFTGETLCEADYVIPPFEEIKHLFEPVVTKAIEPKDPRDLEKVVNFLRQVSKEDPTLKVYINQETGEYLVSGLGELHIEAKVERPLKEKLGLEVITSPPIVVYRETVRERSPVVEGKSANKHNKFYITVEPLEEGVYQGILSGKIEKGEVKKKEAWKAFAELGMDKEDAKGVKYVEETNVFIDATKGIQYLNEAMELILDAFRQICSEGPLAKEPLSRVKVKLVDAVLHEDAVHRGPAQVIPAVKHAIAEAMRKANPTLLEPIQTIRIDTPEETLGNVIDLIQMKRGQIIDMKTEEGASVVQAKLPVAEMFGFEASLKSATQGRGFYSLIDVTFEKIPEDLKDSTIAKIRERKGLS